MSSRGCFNSRSKSEYLGRITDRSPEWQWPPSGWVGADAVQSKRKREDRPANAVGIGLALLGPPGGFASALRGVKPPTASDGVEPAEE